ncbi:MAG: undecaprenyl/decaprenyl-phosphate alpha-N-acetylglucosaminyl 1-phosphate transferase [Victivallales bacterium]|nr:undecaprenyl/decaprenyl-phosphate alpha-N-acetylglucosaminyl 1-phosphate transferase [Victivallales bacterium]
MITWWNIYVLAALCAMGFAMLYTPLCRVIALKRGFLDKPAEQLHKGHSSPTPLLGGIAIYASVVSTVIMGMFVLRSVGGQNASRDVMENLQGVMSVTPRIIFISLAGLMSVLVGLYDDRFNMSAKAKLCCQFAIAAVAVSLGGVHISAFINVYWVTWCITVFWIVFMMNAINFFDNMDGLAAGTAAIAFCFFAIAAAVREQYFVAVLGSVFAGSTFGFWFFNHSPATIFMGDSGSHLLGYMLATLGCMVTYYESNESRSPLSILIPVFILAIPVFDLLAVMVIRYIKGKPIYIGDHNHISHRFTDMGLSRRASVLMVHLLVLTIGMSVIPMLWGDQRTAAVSLVQSVTILLMVSILQFSSVKRGRP